MGLPRPHEPRIKGCRSVIYSWREPEDFSSYPVTKYRLTVIPQGGQERLFVLDAMTIGQVVSGLDANVTHTATVSASADDGLSWGPEVPFESIIPVKKPSVEPSLVTAMATGWGTATITWSDSQQGAWVEIQTLSSNPDDSVYGKRVEGQLVEFTGLNPDSVYQFSVQYGNIAGTGPAALTNSVDFTGFTAPEPAPESVEESTQPTE